MGEKLLLDCTLRDGGYVNDWEFGHNNLISIFERITDASVDIVEVGFLDDRRPFDINRSIFPNTESLKKIWGNITNRPKMVVGMVDYGTCSIENIEPCSESFLDGIRVIFKKQKMHGAMEFCRELKKLGYKVFSQLVSITAYSDDDLLELVSLVNDVKPYALSMVDTYGLLNPISLLHYYEILDRDVNSSINIGFHAHNNFQLGYANAVTFLSKPTDRNIVVDGTLFGMGKSAGNDPIELVAMYMNREFAKNYNIRAMMESIEESIKSFYATNPWGYKSFYYLSASNECHPSYVEFFQKKECLSVTMLDELLARIGPNDKKLMYDKDLAESLFISYIENNLDDNSMSFKLSELLSGRKVLIVGPGKNIFLQRDKVINFIKDNDPIVISINFIPSEIKADVVFATKANRYQEMAAKLLEMNIKIIATSNITCRNGSFDYVFNRRSLLELKEEIKDNSFLMLLKIMDLARVRQVFCAGLDGYSDKDDNYISPGMEYAFIKHKAMHLNSHIKNVISEMRKKIDISFITFSKYDVDNSIDSASF